MYSRITDAETASADLDTVDISYMPQGGSWTTVSATYNPTYNYWYVDWVIPGGASLDIYDVKVDVSDGDGGTDSKTDIGELPYLMRQ